MAMSFNGDCLLRRMAKKLLLSFRATPATGFMREKSLKIRLFPFPGCLRLSLSWFNWWVSFAPEFQCCYFCESSCLFYLSFNFDFYVSKIMHL